ncbi:MAG: aldehyde dehydrogenase family protein, partial [Hyphomicrobiales bacterium]
QVLETSDVPAGVVNIVTGATGALARTLAEHANVDAVWYAGTADGSGVVEAAAADNLKRSWVDYGKQRDWFDAAQGEGREYLTHAVEVKNIWVPYGE